MLDPPHHGGHSPNHQHGHEAHDAVEEIEGQDRPLTPSHLQPPVACRAQSDSGSDTSLSQSRSVEFELPSPISPSRPRSPWALFDPYSNNERLNVPLCFCCSWKSVADYIDQQFEQYFRDESGLNRKNIQDNRVHCCLYFISPFGHGEEIEQYGIKIYQFPDCDSDEDEEFKQQDHELKDLKDVTRETHYENYRAQCIQSMTRMVVKERNRKYVHNGQTVKMTLSYMVWM
ncbi:hypothetical protein XENOCAPTIV_022417 [Xenoophorus captivus]|uniref:Septin-type G domain-containing protein n=1 Tax=Xenoophorus captivus TaxID=1517983 RepID=A0ABV0RMV3_9TELE